MEIENFINQKIYEVKISYIKSSEKEYINIYIKNTISNGEFNSNFDFVFLKYKSFFQDLNLKIIHDIIKLQIKTIKSKLKIIQLRLN